MFKQPGLGWLPDRSTPSVIQPGHIIQLMTFGYLPSDVPGPGGAMGVMVCELHMGPSDSEEGDPTQVPLPRCHAHTGAKTGSLLAVGSFDLAEQLSGMYIELQTWVCLE